MIKKINIICIYTALVLLIGQFTPVKADTGQLYVNAKCAVALDCKSKVVLYGKNAYMLVPMASTTKIMTALVAIKYGNLDRKVEISSKSANIHGSTVGYKKGEQLTIKELIFGLMLRSGNDAAIALAEGISGSTEQFVKLMNEYARTLGICTTNFESPHGLDSFEHYSTAYDLALITAYAKENELFNQIVGAKEVDGKTYGFTRSYRNINKILYQMPNATGVKTGYTGQAGKCLVTSATVKGSEVIAVVLNSPGRWKETIKIYNYVSKNYDFKKMFSKGDIVGDVKVGRETVKLAVKEDIIIPTKAGCEYTSKIIKPNFKIEPPVDKDAAIGSINIMENDNILFTDNLVADNPTKKIKKKRFLFF